VRGITSRTLILVDEPTKGLAPAIIENMIENSASNTITRKMAA
jgi:ABC-type branched-subunit amino acid transport system ATPase component